MKAIDAAITALGLVAIGCCLFFLAQVWPLIALAIFLAGGSVFLACVVASGRSGS